MIRNRPACLLCLHGLGSLLSPPFAPLSFSRCMATGLSRRRKPPSRLVLSTKVAERSPDTGRKPEPTHGMNQTKANIPPPISREGRRRPDFSRERSSRNERPNFKNLKMAQSLSVVSRTQRTSVESRIEHWSSFDDFDLLPSIKDGIKNGALKGLDTVEPSPVQKLVIPALTGQSGRTSRPPGKVPYESFLIAAETGSGKTLSYVVPILDYLKRNEELFEKKAVSENPGNIRNANPRAATRGLFDLEIPTVEPKEDRENYGKPRAVILVPTSELVTQVGSVVKAISHIAKFRTTMISSNFCGEKIRNLLFSGPLDVLVSTPHLLSSIAQDDPKILSKCTHIVVDEADSLFDRSFVCVTTSIIDRAQSLDKLILCSATIPKSLDGRLNQFYPEMHRLVSSKIHTIPRRIVLWITDVNQDPYRGAKNLACADTLAQIAKEPTEENYVKKVIVFVNRRATTTELASYLRSRGFDAADIGRDTEDRKNGSAMEYFVGPKVAAEPRSSGLERMRVLVTTDIASRGIDTKTVKNIVLYDVPYSTIDFIHRLGRLGRMGRRGKAVLLVDKDTNKAWVKEIKKSMFLGGPLI